MFLRRIVMESELEYRTRLHAMMEDHPESVQMYEDASFLRMLRRDFAAVLDESKNRSVRIGARASWRVAKDGDNVDDCKRFLWRSASTSMTLKPQELEYFCAVLNGTEEFRSRVRKPLTVYEETEFRLDTERIVDELVKTEEDAINMHLRNLLNLGIDVGFPVEAPTIKGDPDLIREWAEEDASIIKEIEDEG
jgi:hypothetical protein